jgi:hypothetical protein
MKRALMTAALFASALLAGNHSAMNGTWTLVPAKSDFGGKPTVQTGTVTIEDREGNVSVSRNFVYEGANESYFYKDLIDGQRNATIKDGKEFKTKARWDHDVLKVTTTQDGATTVEAYSMGRDGTMTANVTRPDHTQFTLVFVRK